jgi:hypothetical protein
MAVSVIPQRSIKLYQYSGTTAKSALADMVPREVRHVVFSNMTEMPVGIPSGTAWCEAIVFYSAIISNATIFGIAWNHQGIWAIQIPRS